MSLENAGWIAAGLVAVLGLIQTARLDFRKRTRSWRLKRVRRRAERAERAAERVLERAGYRIEAVQPALQWVVYCDGDPNPVDLRADLVVSRKGRRYVAEVKTGVVAPSLETAATRRQLLEYSVAYDADGVLLVDMEAERIHEVAFAMPRVTAPRGGTALAWVVAAVAMALAGAAWRASGM